MRSWNGLHARLLDPALLAEAARATVRGKRRRPDVAWFLFRAEEELTRLHEELATDTWAPSPIERVRVRDPKPRVIARSTIADRVVHTALADHGLPVGAYTSQVWASWLSLDGFDHHVARQMKVPGYLRYVDDLFFFADDRAQLAEVRQHVADWLFLNRDLRLKRPDAGVRSCRERLHALGHAIDRQGLQALPAARRRLRAAAANWVWTGRPGRRAHARSLASRVGNLLP